MAYEKKNIRAVIEEINSRKIYLPAIQRKYVWDDDQITRLMDSIMLDIPQEPFFSGRLESQSLIKKSIQCTSL